jgi:hypothetical protein
MSNGEVRIPNRLILTALSKRQSKALRLFTSAKLQGHRAEINALFDELKLHPKTGKRLIDTVVNLGWAGTDGKYLFPRSWQKLNLNKRGGLYLTNPQSDIKKFEALLFAKGLKRIYRKLGGTRPNRKRAEQSDLPARYLFKALQVSERRFKRLKASAQRYKFIAVNRQYSIVGKYAEYSALKKNLPGLPIFRRGKHCVVPDISRIKVLI